MSTVNVGLWLLLKVKVIGRATKSVWQFDPTPCLLSELATVEKMGTVIALPAAVDGVIFTVRIAAAEGGVAPKKRLTNVQKLCSTQVVGSTGVLASGAAATVM